METMIMKRGVVVCSTAEARKWEEEVDMPELLEAGDTIIRYQHDGTPEIGRVGVKGAITQIDNGYED